MTRLLHCSDGHFKLAHCAEGYTLSQLAYAFDSARSHLAPTTSTLTSTPLPLAVIAQAGSGNSSTNDTHFRRQGKSPSPNPRLGLAASASARPHAITSTSLLPPLLCALASLSISSRVNLRLLSILREKQKM